MRNQLRCDMDQRGMVRAVLLGVVGVAGCGDAGGSSTTGATTGTGGADESGTAVEVSDEGGSGGASDGGFSFDLDETPLTLALYDVVPVGVTLTRSVGFTEPVEIYSHGATPGGGGGVLLTNPFETTIEAGQSEGVMAVQAISQDGGEGLARVFAYAEGGGAPEEPAMLPVRVIGSSELHDPGFGTQSRFTREDTGHTGAVAAIELDADGNILIGGSDAAFTQDADVSMPVMRLTKDGQVDAGWAAASPDHVASVASAPVGEVRSIHVDDAGRILAVGTGPNAVLIARYTAGGQPDATFGVDGVVVDDLSPRIVNGGRSVRAADDSLYFGASDFVARYTPTGARDASFGTNGLVELGAARISSIAVRADGALFAVGTLDSEAYAFGFSATGAPLPGFAADGKVAAVRPAEVPGAAFLSILRDGDSSLVIGRFDDESFERGELFVQRLRDDGSFDPAFGEGGMLRVPAVFRPTSQALARTPMGAYFAVGVEDASGNGIAAAIRFDADGALDPSFGVNGHHRGRFTLSGRSGYLAVRVLADGSALVGGYQGNYDYRDWFVARYLP